MFIEKICISGFKNYKETTIYDFSDYSVIKGRNSQGKSSIGEAIVWGLYGCDLNGDTKADSKLLNEESDAMYVIIDFYNEGKSNRIVRKKSKSITLKFNDERISEKDLAKYLPNKELFLAIFNPKYFLSYGVAKQRSLLLKMLPTINPADIIQKYNAKDITHMINKYPNINDGLKEYSSLISSKKNLIDTKNSQLSVYQNLILENSKKPDNVDIFTEDDEKQLNELQLTLTVGTKVKEIPTDNLKSQADNLKSAIEFETNKEFKSTNANYLSDLNISLAKLSGELDSLNKIYSKLLSCDSVCPTCGQPINQEHRQKELEILLEKMNNIDLEKTSLKESIKLLEGLDNSNRSLFNSEKNTKIEELNRKLDIINQNILDIQNSNQLLNKDSNDIGIQEINEQINNLKNKQIAYLEYQNNLKSHSNLVKSYKEKMNMINIDIDTLNNLIITLEIEYQQLKDYSSYYVQYIGEILSSWLDKVTIDLFTVVQTTGEIKDAFEVKYDNKPIRLISNSEYTKTGLEISNMFNKCLDISIPVFVDDAESIIEIPKLDTQMLVAMVKNCDLKIVNSQVEEVVQENIKDVEYIANFNTYEQAEQMSF